MEQYVLTTMSNTLKIDKKVNSIEEQLNSLEKDIAVLLKNQAIINENLNRILAKIEAIKE